MFCLHVCVSTIICAWFPQRPKKNMRFPYNWSYRQLWASVWVLGFESVFSARAASALTSEPALQPHCGWVNHSTHRRQRQVGCCECQSSLGYVVRPSLSHIYMELPIIYHMLGIHVWLVLWKWAWVRILQWMAEGEIWFIFILFFLFLSAIYLLFALVVSKFLLDLGSNTKINLCAAKGRPQEWLANDL